MTGQLKFQIRLEEKLLEISHVLKQIISKNKDTLMSTVTKNESIKNALEGFIFTDGNSQQLGYSGIKD